MSQIRATSDLSFIELRDVRAMCRSGSASIDIVAKQFNVDAQELAQFAAHANWDDYGKRGYDEILDEVLASKNTR